MKVLFVFFSNGKSCMPPLGILTLATVLKNNGYEAYVTDSGLYADKQALRDYILKINPDVLGLSVISMVYEDAVELAAFIKEACPQCKIIVGGPHATALPELVAGDKNVDLVSIGESEETILEIMEAIKNNGDYGKIRGVAYRNSDGKVCVSEKRGTVANFDSVPIPDRGFLPMEKYLARVPDLQLEFPTTSIMVTRGCYGNCMYCQPLGRKLFGAGIRRRSPELVVAEIEYLLKTYPIKSLWFVDDEPTWHGEDWMIQVCDLICKKKLKFTWSAAARVDQISDRLLSAMHKAGCRSLMFGVESGSEKILNIMRKGYHPARIYEAMDICRRNKIISRAQLMVGTPGETRETLNETLRMIEGAKPDLIGIGITTPTPGSDLYNDLKDSDALQVKNWKDFDRFVINPIKLEFVTPDDLRDAIQSFYRAHMKYHLQTLINPILFVKRFHFVKAIFWHFASQLASPAVLWSDIKYYFLYSRTRSSSREAEKVAN